MKLIASAFVIIAMSFAWFFTSNMEVFDVDSDGTITIVLIDKNGDIVSSLKHDFLEEDTLFTLLVNEYDVVYDNHPLGRVILAINDIETDFERDFIRISITGQLSINQEVRYMEDEMSPLGIDRIPLVDGNTYIFRYQRVGS